MKLLCCSVLFDSGFEFVVRVNGRSEKEMTSEAFKSPNAYLRASDVWILNIHVIGFIVDLLIHETWYPIF
ncbi:hypothetical protein Hanom_Chr00s075776g01791091 [Helianthus anomalus]